MDAATLDKIAFQQRGCRWRELDGHAQNQVLYKHELLHEEQAKEAEADPTANVSARKMSDAEIEALCIAHLEDLKNVLVEAIELFAQSISTTIDERIKKAIAESESRTLTTVDAAMLAAENASKAISVAGAKDERVDALVKAVADLKNDTLASVERRLSRHAEHPGATGRSNEGARMIPPGVQIVGIASADYNCELGVLRVRLQLSDGSTCASFWEASDLRNFMAVITEPTQRPLGAALQ